MDPRRWDEDSDRNTARADKLVRAAGACLGCPVVRECAAEALDTGAVGVVRAGIPLAAKPGRGARAALAAIANEAVEPLHAAMAFADTSPALRLALGPLEAMAHRAGVEVPHDHAGQVGA